MSQTGGGCRATNYIGFIRKALKDAGFANVPIISFNFVGMEKMPGFKLSVSLLDKIYTKFGNIICKVVLSGLKFNFLTLLTASKTV